MRRCIAWLFLLAALPLSAQIILTPPTTIARLRQRLAARLAEPRFASAQWGVKVISLDTGKTLFESNASKLLSPASNTKLFTCAFALDRLGPEHRIRTSLLATNRPDARGVLHSDLIVYGRGDPTFTAQRGEGNIHQVLAPIVTALTNAGVRAIQGDLIGDDSFLPGFPVGSGWDWDDPQHAYGAELSALSINENVLRVLVRPSKAVGSPAELTVDPPTQWVRLSNLTQTVGTTATQALELFRPPGGNLTFFIGNVALGASIATNFVTVHNPAGLFASLLRESLERAGVRVTGKVGSIGWDERQSRPLLWSHWIELAAVESPPLQEVVRETLKRSQNLYAGLLFRNVGVFLTSTNSLESAEARGASELTSFLKQAGISRREFFFNEGSGLSRENLVTANAIVRLLDFMSRHPAAYVFTNALPVAGVDGTLESRMPGTVAERNVRAKTGALRWADALSGYVNTRTGERLAFALLLNRYQDTGADAPARQELDTIAIWLAGLRQHSRDWKP